MKFLHHFRRLAAGLALLIGATGAARAEDIDIFAGSQPVGTNSPYLLFVIDTGAAFNANVSDFRCSIAGTGLSGVVDITGNGTSPTPLDGKGGGVEQCAMFTVIKALYEAQANVYIGVMFMNGAQKTLNPATGALTTVCPNTNVAGGCVALPFTNLTATTTPNILDWVRQWSNNGNYGITTGSDRGDGATMQEAWAYFFGKTGISGQDYASMAPSANCASKHIVFLANAYRQQAVPKDKTSGAYQPSVPFLGSHATSTVNASPTTSTFERSTTDMSETYTSLKCGTSTKSGTVPTGEGDGAYALYWARYLRNQGVSTYSVGIVGTDCNETYVAQLTHMARDVVGGGKYFGTNSYDELVEALKTIVSEVQSVNSVFASAALPASVNTQGLYLNQVFIGMFRPATDFLPRWAGNLKHYKMGLVSNELQLQDAADTDAINTQTGFVTECARSFWSKSLPVDTYWSGSPRGTCATDGAKASDTPDGNVVEKGAQAYKLRAITPADRTVKTCGTTMATCSSSASVINFNTTTLSSLSTTTFLATSASDKENIINWSRGLNVDDELNKGTTVMRPSVHGDVVHSRPVAVNHGTDDSPKIVVYYGGNDGLFRSVAASRTTDLALTAISGTVTSTVTYTAGAEIWSFMPPEFYSKIGRLRANTEAVSHPYIASGTGSPKDYGIDGPITALQYTTGGVAKTYIYATMRRGGRAIYAFDASYPASPTLLWKKGCSTTLASDADCSTDFTQIGQTWSSLRTMYATGYGGGTSPLLITGGGYDTCEDYDASYAAGTTAASGKNHNCIAGPGEGGGSEASGVTKGNRIFILDAATGNVVRQFKTRRAVIADVVILRDSDGKATYGYTADMGGYVYRLSLSGNATSDWTITTIASLGCDDPGSCTDSVANRKFMFAPSVLSLGDNKYSILLGSGDREKPVTKYASSKGVTNRFFHIVDDVQSSSYFSNLNATCDGHWICVDALYGITTSTTPAQTTLDTKPHGWYLGLTSTEQVVTNAITIFGVTTFSTHMPSTGSASACAVDLGTTRVYNVSYKNGQGVYNGQLSNTRYADVSGDGLPPSPIGGRVKLDDGTIVPFCMGCDPGSPEKPKKPTGLAGTTAPKSRLYWYIEK